MDFDVVAARQEMARAEAAARRNFALLARIRDHLCYRKPDERAALTLNEALCLPVLGGVMRTNGNHTPSSSFKKSALELAIRKGRLKATMVNGKLRVTPEAVRTWVTASEKPDAVASPTKKYLSPDVQANRDKQAAVTSQEMVRAKLAALKQARKKGAK